MSTKEEKPTLAGVQNKTRKRNIVIPVDPGSFAEAVIQIIQDSSEEGLTSEAGFDAATKALDAADLEFARYGDTLFEVLFSGGRLLQGGDVNKDTEKKLSTNVLSSTSDRDAIAPFVKMFGTLSRRRPFLIRGLENTLSKLLLSLEFYNEADRRRIAIALAQVCTQKIPLMLDNVFNSMLNDRLVAKGTILEVLTIVLQEVHTKDGMEELVAVLNKAKIGNKLLDFFPPPKRNDADFGAHFEASGLGALVQWNSQREVETKIAELQGGLAEMITADPPAPASEVLAYVKSHKAEHKLPEAEVLRVGWQALMKSINMTGKNQQQIMQAIVAKIKTYHKLLSTFATSGKLELSLLNNIQVYCYEDNRLLKLFCDIVRLLYDAEILGEDTVRHWYKKGSHAKGRNVFLKDIEPFIKWLDEAEEDEEEK